MRIEGSIILITGAAGGIGSSVARRLGAGGAALCLTDFRSAPLEALACELREAGVTVDTIAADLGCGADRARITALACKLHVEAVVNVAGINPFGMFQEQSDAEIEKALAINTVAPILLCRALIPVLAQRTEAHIVNVGSVFGSLGYPGFAVYSASKFAVRGFTEALRRELADTSIRLHYVAPRATQTALSTDRISAMNTELNVATDSPKVVAAAIESSLSRSRREVFLGRPERLFALLNALMPGVIDRALRKQLGVIRRYASCAESQSDKPESTSIDLEIQGA